MRLKCLCGWSMKFALEWNPAEYALVHSKDLDEAGDKPWWWTPLRLWGWLKGRSTMLVRCPECSRVYIQWERGGDFVGYAPYDPQPGPDVPEDELPSTGVPDEGHEEWERPPGVDGVIEQIVRDLVASWERGDSEMSVEERAADQALRARLASRRRARDSGAGEREPGDAGGG